METKYRKEQVIVVIAEENSGREIVAICRKRAKAMSEVRDYVEGLGIENFDYEDFEQREKGSLYDPENVIDEIYLTTVSVV